MQNRWPAGPAGRFCEGGRKRRRREEGASGGQDPAGPALLLLSCARADVCDQRAARARFCSSTDRILCVRGRSDLLRFGPLSSCYTPTCSQVRNIIPSHANKLAKGPLCMILVMGRLWRHDILGELSAIFLRKENVRLTN